MRKFIKKIVGIFTIIGIYLVKFANKIYALSAGDIVPEYGVIEPLERHNIFVNAIFLVLLPIAAIITIIIGTIKYIKNSRDSKAVKILISIIALIVIVILIRVLVLGINNLLK